MRITEQCGDTEWEESNEWEKGMISGEKKRAGKRGGTGRKMYLDALNISL